MASLCGFVSGPWHSRHNALPLARNRCSLLLPCGSWQVAQPILDRWASTPADFPNYIRSTWGPKAAAEMIAKDGRRWFEVVTEDVLKQSPLFRDGDPVFLEQVIMALKPRQAAAGEQLITRGEIGRELYLIEQGEVDVIDENGVVIKVLTDGDVFGEIGVLMSTRRTADVRARTSCDLFVLDKSDFSRILRDNPQFAKAILQVASAFSEAAIPERSSSSSYSERLCFRNCSAAG